MWRIEYEKIQDPSGKISKEEFLKEQYLSFLGFQANNNNDVSLEEMKIAYTNKNKEWKDIQKDILDRRIESKKGNVNPACYKTELEEFLLADFSELINVYLDFMEVLEWRRIKLASRRKKTIKINKKKRKEKKDPLLIKIEKCFDYNYYATGIANFFIHYEKELRISSCFYCDTGYINYIPGVKTEKDFVKKRLFEVDHVIGKKRCPILALCLKNFVPSCKVCNSSTIKGQKEFLDFFKIEANKYSYDELLKLLCKLSPSSSLYRYNENVHISVLPNKGDELWFPTNDFYHNQDKYRIYFEHIDPDYEKITEAFLLKQRYNYGYHLAEALCILDLQKRYTKANIKFIKDILCQNGNSTITEEQIEEDIFHNSLNNDTVRIFSKMKKDILK